MPGAAAEVCHAFPRHIFPSAHAFPDARPSRTAPTHPHARPPGVHGRIPPSLVTPHSGRQAPRCMPATPALSARPHACVQQRGAVCGRHGHELPRVRHGGACWGPPGAAPRGLRLYKNTRVADTGLGSRWRTWPLVSSGGAWQPAHTPCVPSRGQPSRPSRRSPPAPRRRRPCGRWVGAAVLVVLAAVAAPPASASRRPPTSTGQGPPTATPSATGTATAAPCAPRCVGNATALRAAVRSERALELRACSAGLGGR